MQRCTVYKALSLQYAGLYCMQGCTVCRAVLYAGLYCMQGCTVCRAALFSGLYAGLHCAKG